VSGESAGAIAIGSFLVAGRGKAVQRLNLFRGAIMESGAPSGYAVLSFSRQALMNYLSLVPSDGVPIPSYFEDSYRKFASLAGCGPALSDRTSLQCLRGISADVLTNVSIAVVQPGLTLPFNRVQDGYFHDALASQQVREGRVATVPLLIGGLVLSRDELCTLTTPDRYQSG